jgi:hypothetical protein
VLPPIFRGAGVDGIAPPAADAGSVALSASPPTVACTGGVLVELELLELELLELSGRSRRAPGEAGFSTAGAAGFSTAGAAGFSTEGPACWARLRL